MQAFDQKLAILKTNPSIVAQFVRGIERECLRVAPDGKLSSKPHSKKLGSALTHSWITTDFAESLLEFVTPTSVCISDLLAQLRDIHHFSLLQIDGEQLWPFSMPCTIDPELIQIAQYGTSNSGRMKSLYREGLKNRYGPAMQIISGVHFNFSFTTDFWQVFTSSTEPNHIQSTINSGYFALIRNYYRMGWIIPYLFGASPAICGSFLKKNNKNLPFESFSNGTCYLPYATSLRLSDLGYTSKAQSPLLINLNTLEQYVADVLTAIRMPCAEFEKIGLKNSDGSYRQLNDHVLQIENELYAPIRPKNVPKNDEKPHQALLARGVNYVEVRSLDVNPFSDIGIDSDQVHFLDLFMLWCTLMPSADLVPEQLSLHKRNWNKIVLQGRDPKLMLETEQGEQSQLTLGKQLFEQLIQLAEIVDEVQGGHNYSATCQRLANALDHPDETLSAKVLNLLSNNKSICQLGNEFGQQHKKNLDNYNYEFYTQAQFEQEAKNSLLRQQALENKPQPSFEQYLTDYFAIYH